MQRGLVGSEMCIRDRYMGKQIEEASMTPTRSLAPSRIHCREMNLPPEIKKNLEEIKEEACEESVPSTIRHQFGINPMKKSFAYDSEELRTDIRIKTVSYTHLTLPTILLVQISVVAVSLKKKNKKKHNIIT
eukprot:TRINITY_DN6745_c0_g1_i1.p1 TRINITY_DN6745_c0_g1~~TRINITY_DN6745_c0_g1_i1.p1  ORF type:complete len:132 (-),score=45.35 TRINITY_DN6745_c0_g1_i1:50-445(-)